MLGRQASQSGSCGGEQSRCPNPSGRMLDNCTSTRIIANNPGRATHTVGGLHIEPVGELAGGAHNSAEPPKRRPLREVI